MLQLAAAAPGLFMPLFMLLLKMILLKIPIAKILIAPNRKMILLKIPKCFDLAPKVPT